MPGLHRQRIRSLVFHHRPARAEGAIRKGLPAHARAHWRRADDTVITAWVLAAQMSDSDTVGPRSEEHTSELQSLMRISYAVFCLKKKKHTTTHIQKSSERTNKSISST